MSSGNVFIARSTRTGAVVAKIAKTQNRTTGKFFKSILAAAALSTCAVAQADVTLNFEGDAPGIFFAGGQTYIDDYWIETYGGTQTNDLAGLIIDGSDRYACDSGISCPVNNKSKYLALLDDSYFYFGLADDSKFRLTGLQASFIGAGQASYPATAGLLVLQGFNANGSAVGGALQLGLSGPTSGAFNFANYSTGAFGNQLVSFVRVLGYTCDTSGNCNRSANLANFALDNIVTVPEPTTLALLGLGLAGFGVSRRRRA
jgi:hypothetical protein